MRKTIKRLSKAITTMTIAVMLVPTISTAASWGMDATVFEWMTKMYSDTSSYTSMGKDITNIIQNADTSGSEEKTKHDILTGIENIEGKYNTESTTTAIAQSKINVLNADSSSSQGLVSTLKNALSGILGGTNSVLHSLKPDEVPEITAQTAASRSGDDYKVKLTGKVYLNSENKNSKKWVVLAHGVMMNGQAMADSVGQMYLDNGFNILAPDSRGHGDSEGSVAMGYLESLDLWDWLCYLEDKYKPEEVIIHGISLGGATTVFVSGIEVNGETLEDKNVIGLIEDCGYTSLTGIIKGMLGISDSTGADEEITEEEVSLIEKVLGIAKGALSGLTGTLGGALDKVLPDLLIKLVDVGLTKENFEEYQSALDSLQRCNLPILIIHGTADTTVPFDNSNVIFNTAKNNKNIPYIQRYTADMQAHAFITIGSKANAYQGHVENFINEAENIAEGNTPSSRISNYEYTGSEGGGLIKSLLSVLKLVKNMLF